jgi:hypothetical protein
MDINITAADVRFAIGNQQNLVLTGITDPVIVSNIARIKLEDTTGISEFANTELLRSIIITHLKYFFWTRMNTKDIPEHIREEKKSADKLLSQIRSGDFREQQAEPSIKVKPRHFTVGL